MISFSEFRNIAHEGKADRMRQDALYALGRQISVRFSYVIVRLLPRITANHISLANILVVIAVVMSNVLYGSVAAVTLVLIQLCAVQSAAIGDRVDGEVARFKNHLTQTGIYYDRVFHLLYPFALYVPVGYFFALLGGHHGFLVLATLLAALASLSNTADNFRHSIKYKIQLEGHEDAIRDFYEKPSEDKRPYILFRIARYFVFMIYDWVWALYVVLVLLSVFAPGGALIAYAAHAGVSFAILLRHILVVYPRRSLFSRGDVTSGA